MEAKTLAEGVYAVPCSCAGPKDSACSAGTWFRIVHACSSPHAHFRKPVALQYCANRVSTPGSYVSCSCRRNGSQFTTTLRSAGQRSLSQEAAWVVPSGCTSQYEDVERDHATRTTAARDATTDKKLTSRLTKKSKPRCNTTTDANIPRSARVQPRHYIVKHASNVHMLPTMSMESLSHCL